jgi:hypothetical protein
MALRLDFCASAPALPWSGALFGDRFAQNPYPKAQTLGGPAARSV